jgi:uncharacterized RDD family membrane protein YckC
LKGQKLNKKPEEFALEYAGFWIRLGAAVIDIIVLVLIFYIIRYDVLFKFIFSKLPLSTYIIMATLLLWAIHIVYFVVFWAWRGQTPGKMITGIKIIRTDSSPLTWQYALLRYLGCIASTIILFIGFIWIAFDSRKQGLHDKIADTYVVKLPVRQVIFTTEYLAGEKVGYSR